MISQIASLHWANVGPTSSVTSDQRWQMTFVQCNFAHRPNVGPTCCANVGTMSNMSSSDIGPTGGQRMLHITNVDPMLGQRLPNVVQR